MIDRANRLHVKGETHVKVHNNDLELAELNDLALLGLGTDLLTDAVWIKVLRGDNASSDTLLGSSSSILCTLLTCLSWSFACAGSFTCIIGWPPVPRPDVGVESKEIDGDLTGVWLVAIDGLDAPCTDNSAVRLLVDEKFSSSSGGALEGPR